MSDGTPIVLAKQQFFSNVGLPLSLGKLYVYVSNTSTPTNTWQDRALQTLNTNPIVLDSAGRASIWLDPSVNYKFVLKTVADVTIWTQDNIPGSQLENTIASAATVDIGASSSPMVKVTGTTTITSFGTAYTAQRVLRFTGSLKLTHNAVTLNLPGAVDIQTQDGDSCIVVPVGSPASGWKVVSYQRGNDIAWVESVDTGEFSYLAQNSGSRVSSGSNGIGNFGAARTSVTGGTMGEAAIAQAAFAFNDYPAGLAGAWAFYGTAVREAGVLGPTHGMELDIANWGATVPLYPSLMFSAGQTHALWLCSGGESTATPGLCGTASAAIGFISNDPANLANFDAIFVVGNTAIRGVDGTGGTSLGTFAKLPSGAQIIWFNNATQAVGEIVCSGVTFAGAQRLDMSDFGMLVADRVTGKALFLVDKKANAVNYLAVGAGIAGADPLMEARGDDPVLNFILKAKSTGYVGSPNPIKALKDSGIPAGGTAGYGFTFSTTANFGVFFGSGAPALQAAQGSMYLRSDGSSTSTRAYINTDGATTWTAITTAA